MTTFQQSSPQAQKKKKKIFQCRGMLACICVCKECFNLELVSGRPVQDTVLIKAVWKFRANLLITGKLIQFGWR